MRHSWEGKLCDWFQGQKGLKVKLLSQQSITSLLFNLASGLCFKKFYSRVVEEGASAIRIEGNV